MAPAAPQHLDPSLLPLVNAKDEAEARRLTERVIEEIDPVIRGILQRKWGGSTAGAPGRDGQVAEDVRGEVVLQLLTRLSQLKTRPDRTVTNLRGLVAVTTYRACDAHLRKRYPQRARLKNRLVYLLTQRTNQQGLALWEGPDGQQWCGFQAWQASAKTSDRSAKYQELLKAPETVATRALPGESLAHVNPAELLAALFNWVGGPIELDDLMAVTSHIWGIRDEPEQQTVEDEEGREAAYERVADPRVDVAEEVDQRAYLQWLWSEIRQLPPRQCAALLLNLRDTHGRGVIALLPLQGIATLRQIAEALGMQAEEFAALWNDLPLEDAGIAERLGLARQQVINLRKVARERLARRVKQFEKNK